MEDDLHSQTRILVIYLSIICCLKESIEYVLNTTYSIQFPHLFRTLFFQYNTENSFHYIGIHQISYSIERSQKFSKWINDKMHLRKYMSKLGSSLELRYRNDVYFFLISCLKKKARLLTFPKLIPPTTKDVLNIYSWNWLKSNMCWFTVNHHLVLKSRDRLFSLLFAGHFLVFTHKQNSHIFNSALTTTQLHGQIRSQICTRIH